ncbi:MAG TPA: amidohydrolase [Myxococcales bacterium]|nr:amidohydrolase [Myxococcales bacterium]
MNCSVLLAAALILRGGAVYTLDEAKPWASAVVIDNGRVVYVGDDAGTKAYTGKLVDLKGRLVLPGLHDSHLHPMSGGMSLLRCRLGEFKTASKLYAGVRACAAASKSEWLMGRGWSPGVVTPTVARLDELVPDRPAFLTTEDGYTAWVNSKALKLAGVESDGGVLRGEAAAKVRKILPKPTQAEYREAFRLAAARLNQFGITSLVDANASAAVVNSYAGMELTVRVVAAQQIDPGRGPEQVDELIALRAKTRGPRFRADAAKFFLDGELDQHTAAMLEPYAGSTERGSPIPAEALNAIVRRLDAEGFLIHMHAMGDRAVRAGLDAFEAAAAANGARDRRHQLAHIGVANPEDIPRFGKLGVTANYTAIWAQPEDEAFASSQAALGPARARFMYPFGSIANAGGRVVGSSDWPSPSMNPFEAMEVAVTREPAQERLTLARILAAYTKDAAWAAHEETGTIEIGKAADLIVLDRNLFKIKASEIHKARVLLTLLDGEPVYRAAGF